jgi:predicted nucleotidyltransferase component of viral defense system
MLIVPSKRQVVGVKEAERRSQMIDSVKIKEIAQTSAVSTLFLEREYALLGILLAIGAVPSALRKLTVKGPTALRRVYFHNWRFSEDLHFGIPDHIEVKEFSSVLNAVLEKAGKEYGFRFRIAERYMERRQALVRVLYAGPLRQNSLIQMKFSLHDTLVLDPQEEEVLVDPFPLKPRKVRTMRLEELLAETLRNILVTGEPADFYDAWRLLTQHALLINHEDFRKALISKCQQAGFDLESPQDFLDEELLVPTRAYWQMRLGHEVLDLPTFEEAFADMKTVLPPLFVP